MLFSAVCRQPVARLGHKSTPFSGCPAATIAAHLGRKRVAQSRLQIDTWGAKAGAGTTDKHSDPPTLAARNPLHWTPYARVGAWRDGELRYVAGGVGENTLCQTGYLF